MVEALCSTQIKRILSLKCNGRKKPRSGLVSNWPQRWCSWLVYGQRIWRVRKILLWQGSVWRPTVSVKPGLEVACQKGEESPSTPLATLIEWCLAENTCSTGTNLTQARLMTVLPHLALCEVKGRVNTESAAVQCSSICPSWKRSRTHSLFPTPRYLETNNLTDISSKNHLCGILFIRMTGTVNAKKGS